MHWLELQNEAQLDKIAQSTQPVIIFKHSTRCPVSKFAKKDFELESVLIPEQVSVYLLDLLKFRDISNSIAQRWEVKHESPQALLIQSNVCTHHAAHNHIHVADFVTQL